MRIVSQLLILFLIGSFAACQSKPETIIHEGDFLTLYEQAQQENKLLWIMLGGNENCISCLNAIERIQEQKTFSKFQESYLFYKCDVTDSTNFFLHYIFLMEAIPNSYIINRQGEVVSFHFGNLEKDDLTILLEAAQKDKPIVAQKHHQFATQGKQLLTMQNLLLQANLLYNRSKEENDLHKALELVRRSQEIEPCFYNLYLECKIQQELQNPQAADSCATKALQLCKEGYQTIVYETLANELKNISSSYQASEDKMAKLEFASHDIDCGILENNTYKDIRIEFTNTGDQPLIISHVSSSCGCATPEWSKKPVNPGEKGEIIVKYHAGGKGKFTRSIIVQSNAINTIEKLTLKGEVK